MAKKDQRVKRRQTFLTKLKDASAAKKEAIKAKKPFYLQDIASTLPEIGTTTTSETSGTVDASKSIAKKSSIASRRANISKVVAPILPLIFFRRYLSGRGGRPGLVR